MRRSNLHLALRFRCTQCRYMLCNSCGQRRLESEEQQQQQCRHGQQHHLTHYQAMLQQQMRERKQNVNMFASQSEVMKHMLMMPVGAGPTPFAPFVAVGLLTKPFQHEWGTINYGGTCHSPLDDDHPVWSAARCCVIAQDGRRGRQASSLGGGSPARQTQVPGKSGHGPKSGSRRPQRSPCGPRR